MKCCSVLGSSELPSISLSKLSTRQFPRLHISLSMSAFATCGSTTAKGLYANSFFVLIHYAVRAQALSEVTERAVVYFVMDAVAGARRTPGRHKTGGVPPKPPATLLLSLSPLVFWDFGSLHQRRAVAAAVSSSTSRRRPWLRVAAQAAEHPIPDVPAAPDVEASRITSCRGRPCLFL